MVCSIGDIPEEQVYYCGTIDADAIGSGSTNVAQLADTMMDSKNDGTCEIAELAMGAMLKELLYPLVDHPQHCSIDVIRSEDMTTFVVEVDSDDLEQLAGGSGRTAKSLKLLVSAVGLKSQQRFSVTFRKKSGGIEASVALFPETYKT